MSGHTNYRDAKGGYTCVHCRYCLCPPGSWDLYCVKPENALRSGEPPRRSDRRVCDLFYPRRNPLVIRDKQPSRGSTSDHIRTAQEQYDGVADDWN